MKLLITGGCGFIGSNTARRCLAAGHEVALLDNLQRPGAAANLAWLQEQGRFEFTRGDVRDADLLARLLAAEQYDAVIHLAAQVAVTTSVVNPRHDFEVNALGTFNLLEAARLGSPDTIILNASTNKVYGGLEGAPAVEEKRRYFLPDLPLGVSESQPLDFHSPYGCSKGAGEQYVVDYHRIYGLRTLNLRQSCIYGYRQFGVEDQGWVAWFTIAHVTGRPIHIYGNGKQVRDLLFVDDLVDLYLLSLQNIDRVTGRSFNVGGGTANALSLLEFLDKLFELSGRPVAYDFADWRPGDQPVYISDMTALEAALDWRPQISTDEGLRRLYEWVTANRPLFER